MTDLERGCAIEDPERSCAIPGLTPEVYARWRATELGAITERHERETILLVVDHE